MDTNETKICKHCQTEIPKKAKICPNCRKKQGKKGWLIIAAVVVVIIIAVTSIGNGDTNSPASNTKSNTADANNGTSDSDKSTEEVKEYISCTAKELVDMLDDNALKASKTYKDQYVKLTGYFSSVDSSGDYFNIEPKDSDWSLTNIQCFIDDSLTDAVAEFTKGQKITVKGYCSSVGEFLGYSIDVESVK